MSAEIQTLHVPFAEWLRREGIPFVRARSDRESTIAAGHPDFTLLAQGRVLLIEFKDKGGVVSSDQEKRTAELENAGCKVHVIRDLKVAIELTQAWRSTLGEILVSADAPKATANLVRFGASIFRRESGRLQHVRTATPADSSIPVLAAA